MVNRKGAKYSHGSVAKRLKCDEIVTDGSYSKFTAESAGERTPKIGRHLAKLWTSERRHYFLRITALFLRQPNGGSITILFIHSHNDTKHSKITKRQ